jgi:hypothetical protein
VALAAAPVRSAPLRSARRPSHATQERLGQSVRAARKRTVSAVEPRFARQIAADYFGSIEAQIRKALPPLEEEFGGATLVLVKQQEEELEWTEEDAFDIEKMVDWEKAEKDLGRIVSRQAVAIDDQVRSNLVDLILGANPDRAGLPTETFTGLPRSGDTGAAVVDFRLGGGLDKATIQDIGERVTRINAETRDRLKRTVYKGLNDGLSPQQLAKALIGQVGTWRGKDGTIAHSRAMVIARTETGIVYNRSSVLRSAQTGLVDDMICLDNPDCGWIGHDSGDKRNGKAVSFEEALDHPLSHPNCVRAYAPNVEGLGVAPAARPPAAELPPAEPGLPPELPWDINNPPTDPDELIQWWRDNWKQDLRIGTRDPNRLAGETGPQRADLRMVIGHLKGLDDMYRKYPGARDTMMGVEFLDFRSHPNAAWQGTAYAHVVRAGDHPTWKADFDDLVAEMRLAQQRGEPVNFTKLPNQLIEFNTQYDFDLTIDKIASDTRVGFHPNITGRSLDELLLPRTFSPELQQLMFDGISVHEFGHVFDRWMGNTFGQIVPGTIKNQPKYNAGTIWEQWVARFMPHPSKYAEKNQTEATAEVWLTLQRPAGGTLLGARRTQTLIDFLLDPAHQNQADWAATENLSRAELNELKEFFADLGWDDWSKLGTSGYDMVSRYNNEPAANIPEYTFEESDPADWQGNTENFTLDDYYRSVAGWQHTFYGNTYMKNNPTSPASRALREFLDTRPALEGAVYKGVSGLAPRVGDRVEFPTLSSTTPDIDTAKAYVNGKDPVIFEILGGDARSLSGFDIPSMAGAQEAVLLPANYEVVSIRQQNVIGPTFVDENGKPQPVFVQRRRTTIITIRKIS